MSAPAASGGTPIEGKDQLVAYMDQGSKPPANWRIGTEHEKFVYALSDYRPLPYEGETGIRAMLEGLVEFGWTPVVENGNIIALSRPEGDSVTLEPGGQLELSGKLVQSIHETCTEVHQHLHETKQVAARIGAGMVGMGFIPKWKRDEIPWMPKGRYQVMKRYMPTVGTMGLDMMLRTCTVQVNLDYESEADMVRKMRVSIALQPLATALFANSPFTEGKPNGYLSYRSHVWTDTDPDRTGMLGFVFEDGFGFERWVDYLLNVPMYFVYRDGKYHDVAGKSFKDFLAGRLEGFEGQIPHMGDWTDHMTTSFPEVRLKRFIEMRGADGGPWGRLCALPALWVGLLYDSQALNEAEALIRDWSVAEMGALRDAVPKLALNAPHKGRLARDWALDMLKISRDGLKRRAMLSRKGSDEQHYLDELFEIAESGITPAERLLEAYHGRWKGEINPVYDECHY